jgi:hypothetical protein
MIINAISLLGKVIQAVTLLGFIREVPNNKLGRETENSNLVSIRSILWLNSGTL